MLFLSEEEYSHSSKLLDYWITFYSLVSFLLELTESPYEKIIEECRSLQEST